VTGQSNPEFGNIERESVQQLGWAGDPLDDLDRAIGLDTEIPNCVIDLRMSKQQLLRSTAGRAVARAQGWIRL
jgi:hypothetical protein